MRFSEKWGDSIDEAVNLALADLGLSSDQVKVTVLEQPSRGFLGIIGNKLARVRVEEIVPEKEPEPVKEPVIAEPKKHASEQATSKPESNHKEKNQGRNKKKSSAQPKETPQPKEKKKEKKVVIDDSPLLSERPADLLPDDNNIAQTFLVDLFKEMGLNVSVKVYSNAECVYAEVEGPDCGTVIGKRGQTLDSIQYLASLVVNKGEGGYIRTIIDAEGYRKKREITLEKLALRLADKAVKNKRSVRLEPMNPYERKVIHSVLQKYDGVSTRSEGDEPYRRVIIEPDKK